MFFRGGEKMSKKYTSKEAKNMILDVASILFVEKGYEKTSISDIERGLNGLTRGAIYHHFSNKEEIIKAVVRRFIPDETTLLQVDTRTDLNGLEKIQELLIENLFNEEAGASMNLGYPLLNDPKYYSMYNAQIVAEIVPQIERYLIEGNQDGSLSVQQPRQMAEIIILLISTWFIPALFPTTMDTFFEKLTACSRVFAQSGINILSEEVMEEILTRLKMKMEEQND